MICHKKVYTKVYRYPRNKMLSMIPCMNLSVMVLASCDSYRY
ncbi:MAG: hypothetical protein ACTS73_07025 [Arsenophonus sp. NEOnobi-MAG3]